MAAIPERVWRNGAFVRKGFNHLPTKGVSRMAKPTIEFSDTLPMGQWRQVEGASEGIFEKILSHDPETGSLTRLVRFRSGVEIPKTQIHDFCEEVFILEGYMIDTEKNLTAAAGYYACRPVGMVHGPYRIPVTCLCFETRYQDLARPLDASCSLLKSSRSPSAR